MKKTLVAVAMMAAAVLGMMAAPAVAATSGSERFTIFGQDDTQTVVATGAFFAVGHAITLDDDNDLFVFPAGTFHVNHPQTGGNDSFNEVACIGRSTFTGTYTISQGTGAYAGISGSGTYSGKAIFTAARTADGCSDEGGSFFVVVNAPGSVSLP